ncbi:hypothetical protein KKF84_10055 [Myxococcota bacterium]|nr:hypothetical protein [Myxococcota bacterium]MBU1535654.1 hypothetical protein [Myxococcota bacterium]
MDNKTVEKIITDFIKKTAAEKKQFMKRQLDIMARYTTPEIVEAIKDMHEVEAAEDESSVDEVTHDESAQVYNVLISDGSRYEVGATDEGAGKIEDFLLLCECQDDEDTKGKCPMCGGNGDIDDDTECPMCEGMGTCPTCGGEGIISLRDAEASHEHGAQPEDEPLSGEKELMEDVENWEKPNKKLAKFIASYLYELDKLYYANYKQYQEYYREFFNTEAFDYPHMIFPNYFSPYMDEFTEEEDGKLYGTVEVGGENLLLTVGEKDDTYVIEALEVECSMSATSPELHEDTYLECNCADNTADGNPNESCEVCHGTGVVTCPICLGMGWIPIAPVALSADDINDPERYKKGVSDLYDVD